MVTQTMTASVEVYSVYVKIKFEAESMSYA